MGAQLQLFNADTVNLPEHTCLPVGARGIERCIDFTELVPLIQRRWGEVRDGDPPALWWPACRRRVCPIRRASASELRLVGEIPIVAQDVGDERRDHRDGIEHDSAVP